MQTDKKLGIALIVITLSGFAHFALSGGAHGQDQPAHTQPSTNQNGVDKNLLIAQASNPAVPSVIPNTPALPNTSDGATLPTRAVDDAMLMELPDTKELKSALLKRESFSDDPVENTKVAGAEAARLMRKMQELADRLHISTHAVQIEFSELVRFGERNLVESNNDLFSQLDTAMLVNSGLTPEQKQAKRKQVAANFDQYFLDHNRESSTSAYGPGGTSLKITDPLAGRVRTNQLTHTLPFIDLKEAGFKRITYTNGDDFSTEWVLTRR
jgi:hypothetical protein